MAEIVLDASAVLAMLRREPGGDAVLALIQSGVGTIHLSSVNLGEVVTQLVRRGVAEQEVDLVVHELQRFCEPLDCAQGMESGKMYRGTSARGLSLGDRACLALARARGAEAWTTDRAWAGLDVGVEVRLLR